MTGVLRDEKNAPKTLQIRSSTAEFLIFTSQAGENSIEVRVEGETVWLTQKMMAQLFDVQVPAIAKHIANILEEAELDQATISKMETVQQEAWATTVSMRRMATPYSPS